MVLVSASARGRPHHTLTLSTRTGRELDQRYGRVRSFSVVDSLLVSNHQPPESTSPHHTSHSPHHLIFLFIYLYIFFLSISIFSIYTFYLHCLFFCLFHFQLFSTDCRLNFVYAHSSFCLSYVTILPHSLFISHV